MKYKSVVAAVIFAAGFLIFSLSIVYFGHFLPLQKKLYERNIVDRIKDVTALSLPLIQKHLNNRSDIDMLSEFEKIMKVEGFKSVFIVDDGMKIIVHNDVEQWDTLVTDESIRQAVADGGERLARHGTGEMIYSVPIASSAVFCAIISKQRMLDDLAVLSRGVWIILAVALVAVSAVYWRFFKYMFGLPLEKLKQNLKSSLTGHALALEKSSNEDINEIIGLINEVVKNPPPEPISPPEIGFMVRVSKKN